MGKALGHGKGFLMNLQVFRLNANKYLETSSVEAFLDAYTDGESLYWVDIAKPDQANLSKFLLPIRLHPLVLEGCLDLSAGSRIAPYKHSLFIKLPTQLSWDNPLHSFLSIICLPQAIITIHESPIPILEDIKREFSTAVRLHTLSTSAILYQIFDRLIDEDMAFALESRRTIDSLEEAIDQEAESIKIDQILALKRKVSHLSIILEDQGHCINALQTIESEVFDIQDLHEYFRDSLAHLDYTLRSVGRQEAHLSELHQHYLLTLQDRTNKRIKLLTILSAVFMPLTLIAGIYGMNFRHMPELTWSFGYPVVIAVMIALASGLLWIFYRRGWFK